MVVCDAKESCGGRVETLSIDKSRWYSVGDSNMEDILHLRFEVCGDRRKCWGAQLASLTIGN